MSHMQINVQKETFRSLREVTRLQKQGCFTRCVSNGKINNTVVGKMCRRAHQDVMFIKAQRKREMSALDSLDKSDDVDKVVHYSLCWARRQTNKQENKQPKKRSRGPQDLTLGIALQQRLEKKSRAWGRTYLSPAENTSDKPIKDCFSSTDTPKGQLLLLLKLRSINEQRGLKCAGKRPSAMRCHPG